MKDDQLENNLSQLISMVILVALIFIRTGAFVVSIFIEDLQEASVIVSVIWIVNYLGMLLACLSLFIEKCKELSKTEHKLHSKYKPFKGLTNFIAILLAILLVAVWWLQSTSFKDCLNDIITLLALLFCVSKNIWSAILIRIAKRL